MLGTTFSQNSIVNKTNDLVLMFIATGVTFTDERPKNKLNISPVRFHNCSCEPYTYVKKIIGRGCGTVKLFRRKYGLPYSRTLSPEQFQ